MKKILFPLAIAIFAIAPPMVFASGGGTFGSNSPQSSAGAILISADSAHDNDTAACYLFDGSGNSFGNDVAYTSNPFTSSTLAAAFCNNPTPSAGTYQVFVISGFSGRGGDLAAINASCGAGHTTSDCNAFFGDGSRYFANGSITISGSPPPPGPGACGVTSDGSMLGNAIASTTCTLIASVQNVVPGSSASTVVTVFLVGSIGTLLGLGKFVFHIF